VVLVNLQSAVFMQRRIFRDSWFGSF